MVTVKQFLDAGFEFVVGDEVSTKSCSPFLIDESIIDHWNKPTGCDDYAFVNSVVWRKNTGVQPVGDGCVVDVLFASGAGDTDLASSYYWDDELLTHWKPSLKHLEQQMTDNQETKTALEMSERDIENYADDCDVERELKESEEVAWVNGEVAYVENSTHDEIVFIGLANNKSVAVCECVTNERKVILDKFWVSDLLKEEPETPEQKAARERMESAYDLYRLANKAAGNGVVEGFDNWRKMSNDNMDKYWLAIVDKTGYRK